jgi:hypothetical protein
MTPSTCKESALTGNLKSKRLTRPSPFDNSQKCERAFFTSDARIYLSLQKISQQQIAEQGEQSATAKKGEFADKIK